MLVIKEIASYIPNKKESNYELIEKFNIDSSFIKDKLGVEFRSIKEEKETASDLCVKAFENLEKKVDINKNKIDCCIVITQNPDFNIPHTSAIVHSKLNLPNNCACFDISLGCSGYVYGLSVIFSFMKENNLKHGLLFTADSYRDILDKNDKNTYLLFGDASTVTYITEESSLSNYFIPVDFLFGTIGKDYNSLINRKNLYMNGRKIFNFVLKEIPKDIYTILDRNNLKVNDINKFIFHQGSKYIIDSLKNRLSLDDHKVIFDIYNYGNTVSSSIPIILEKEIKKKENNIILISGFGVGLSKGTALLKRRL